MRQHERMIREKMFQLLVRLQQHQMTIGKKTQTSTTTPKTRKQMTTTIQKTLLLSKETQLHQPIERLTQYHQLT